MTSRIPAVTQHHNPFIVFTDYSTWHCLACKCLVAGANKLVRVHADGHARICTGDWHVGIAAYLTRTYIELAMSMSTQDNLTTEYKPFQMHYDDEKALSKFHTRFVARNAATIRQVLEGFENECSADTVEAHRMLTELLYFARTAPDQPYPLTVPGSDVLTKYATRHPLGELTGGGYVLRFADPANT